MKTYVTISSFHQEELNKSYHDPNKINGVLGNLSRGVTTSNCSKGGFHGRDKSKELANIILSPDANITADQRQLRLFGLCHSNVTVTNPEKKIELILAPDSDELFMIDLTKYQTGVYTQSRILSDNFTLVNDTTTKPLESMFTSDSKVDCIPISGRYLVNPNKLPGNGKIYLYSLIFYPLTKKMSFINFGGVSTVAHKPEIIRVKLDNLLSKDELSQEDQPQASTSSSNHQTDQATITTTARPRHRQVKFTKDGYSDTEEEDEDEAAETEGQEKLNVVKFKDRKIVQACRRLSCNLAKMIILTVIYYYIFEYTGHLVRPYVDSYTKKYIW